MSQLTYDQNLAIAFPGMLADISPRDDVLSRFSEEVASFGFGTAVIAGTDKDTQVLLPTAAAQKLVGVTAHSHRREVGSDNENLVDTGRAVNVLHVGRIYVKLESSSPAVAAEGALFVRTANPAASPADEALGRFRGDADGGDAVAVATGVRVITGGAAGEIIVIEIDADASL